MERAENRQYAMMIVMTKDQIKEILDRVLTWPLERQADAASVLAEMEAQHRTPLRLNDEQVAEVKRRLSDPNPKFVGLEEVRERFVQRRA
jgi:hypothetical protein